MNEFSKVDIDEKPNEIKTLFEIVKLFPGFVSIQNITSALKPYGLRTDVIKDSKKYGLEPWQEKRVNETDQKFYQEMNNAIKIVIKKFDDIDYFSENNSQKDFFLSMTKYPTFKKKLTRLIDYYNEFAKKYNSLNEVDESDK